ncbi:MAG: sialidase family protein [Gemmatimonadota bacterium]
MRLTVMGLLAASTIVACRKAPAEMVTAIALPLGAGQSADPALALDPENGDLLFSWIGGDSTDWALFFSRSADSGKSWSAPALVAAGKQVRPAGESSPRLISAGQNRVALSWVGSIEVPGRKWPATVVQFARSLDGGRNWSDPQTLNDDTTQAPAGHQFHGAAWSGDSGIVVAWLDERKGPALAIHHMDLGGSTAGDMTDEPDAAIYLASSENFGETWKPLNTNRWGQVCPCCRVTLARGPDGRVVSAWRKHYPGNIRDIVTASVDTGAGGEPARIHPDGWVYPGCPHTGPGLAVGANGDRHVAWYVGKEGDAGVFYQRVVAGMDSQPAPVPLVKARTLPTAHTTIAAIPGGGAAVAYDITASGDRGIGISILAPDGSVVAREMIAGSGGGSYPQVVSQDSRSALVAWTELEGEKRTVRLSRIIFTAVLQKKNSSRKE